MSYCSDFHNQAQHRIEVVLWFSAFRKLILIQCGIGLLLPTTSAVIDHAAMVVHPNPNTLPQKEDNSVFLA